MKKQGFASVLSLLTVTFVANSAFATETYKLDPTHTAITWKIDHFGFSKPSGKFMNVEGTLMLDEKDLSKSKVDVMIPIAKVASGVVKLDEHLQTADFFDTAKFSTAHFVSDKVEVKEEHMLDIHGMLTLHGVTKPVVLHAKMNKIGENFMKKKTAGFSAMATIKRSDFGMTTYLPGLGDDVMLEIETEANLAE